MKATSPQFAHILYFYYLCRVVFAFMRRYYEESFDKNMGTIPARYGGCYTVIRY